MSTAAEVFDPFPMTVWPVDTGDRLAPYVESLFDRLNREHAGAATAIAQEDVDVWTLRRNDDVVVTLWMEANGRPLEPATFRLTDFVRVFRSVVEQDATITKIGAPPSDRPAIFVAIGRSGPFEIRIFDLSGFSQLTESDEIEQGEPFGPWMRRSIQESSVPQERRNLRKHKRELRRSYGGSIAGQLLIDAVVKTSVDTWFDEDHPPRWSISVDGITVATSPEPRPPRSPAGLIDRALAKAAGPSLVPGINKALAPVGVQKKDRRSKGTMTLDEWEAQQRYDRASRSYDNPTPVYQPVLRRREEGEMDYANHVEVSDPVGDRAVHAASELGELGKAIEELLPEARGAIFGIETEDPAELAGLIQRVGLKPQYVRVALLTTQEVTQAEIAAQLGITQPRVSRILKEIRKSFREVLSNGV